jgi:uncharacterized membrane protein/predicted DsbA family dithiol-disulfide isomerase
MRRGLAWALLGLACAGAVISLSLTYIFSRLHREPGWQSVCAISDALDCDVVVLSPYGSVAGVPLSILGIWFYGFVMLVAGLELRARRPCFPRSLATVLWVAAGLAAAASVGLAAVSLLVLRTLCLFCVVLYALNGAMLVVAWSGLRSTGEGVWQALGAERRHWGRHPFRTTGYLGAALAVLWIAGAAYSAGSGGSTVCAAVAAARDTGQDQVTVTVYGDFQCPHCKAVHEALATVREHPGLRIVEAHYPLDTACNPRLKRSRHLRACLQALAAICAGRQGYGKEFSDRLFTDGAKDRDALLELGRTVGLDTNTFAACLRSDEATAELRESIDAAIAKGVRATPTLFVNGRRHVGRLSETDLRCLGGVEGGAAERSLRGAARP